MTKNTVEALLFSAARWVTMDELTKLSSLKEEEVVEHLNLLKQEYKDREGAMRISNDDNRWKMIVTNDYMKFAHKIVNITEFEKPLMETLAVIAWKYPALQCDIVRIRHNKAYEHLSRLEKEGFINRIKYGRTRKITLTPKFFEYFDLPSRKKAQEAFQEVLPQEIKDKVEETERQIEESEKVIEEVKKAEEEAKLKQEEEKNSDKELKKVAKEGDNIDYLSDNYDDDDEEEQDTDNAEDENDTPETDDNEPENIDSEDDEDSEEVIDDNDEKIETTKEDTEDESNDNEEETEPEEVDDDEEKSSSENEDETKSEPTKDNEKPIEEENKEDE